MIFYYIGADYKTASFNAREALSRHRKAIVSFWVKAAPQQAAVLTTCNRIEIYAVASSVFEARKQVHNFFRNFPDFFGTSRVMYGEKNIFTHLVRLACGLESQLQGEPQILEQLEVWQRQDGFAPDLKPLILTAIIRGKEIRRGCGLHISHRNIATIVYDDIKKYLEGIVRYDIIILGTGKIAQLLAEFRPANARLFFAAHRNFSKAKLLAEQTQGNVISLSEILDIGKTADVLISATASPHYLLGFDDVAGIVKGRAKPLHIYDLALVRDIEPGVAGLPGVVLENLNTLGRLFEAENSRISDKLALAEYLCSKGMNDKSAFQERVYA